MRKLFLISLIFVSNLSLTWSQVEISVECQDSWGPGRYNKVSVTVGLGNFDGFARFTQDFPVGLQVVKDKIDAGDFSFDDNQLNVVWIKIPEKNQVTFSYYIMPDLSMYGDIEMNGKVVTVTGGTKKQAFSIPPRKITIGGDNGYLAEDLKARLGKEIVTNVTEKPTPTARPESGAAVKTVYRVQISVSSTRISEDELRKKYSLEKGDKITIVQSGKVYKYQVGSCADMNCAKDLMKRLKDKGIKDPFIVGYRGETQVKT